MSETLEERLTRSLDQQAGGLHDAPFTFDDVRGRARTIRRRRRGVAAGVAAAIVAIALPAALLSGPGDERTGGVDPAPEPTTAAASVLHDGVLTRPDGSTAEVDLPDGVTQVGVLSDGRIVAPVNGRDSGTIRVLDADGSRLADYPVLSTVMTMGVDDATVAWIGPDYRIRVLESGVAEPVVFTSGVPMPGEGEGAIDAVLGKDCAAGGCTVLGGDWTVTQYAITTDGAEELATPEPFRVVDVSPDGTTWAVAFPPGRNEQFGCMGLYDVASDSVTARSCENSLIGFSPDGQHLTATRSDGGPFLGEPAILDLDLQEVGRITHRDGVVSAAGWEDPEHLVVAVADWDGGAWSLLRVGLDGTTVATLDGPAPGELPEMQQEYVITG